MPKPMRRRGGTQKPRSSKAAPEKRAPAKAAPAKPNKRSRPRKGPQAALDRATNTVDGYVTGLPSPLQVIVQRLRELVRDAAPEAAETLKWSQPVFEANGPFAQIDAHENHVNFGFWRGAMLKAPIGVLQDGDQAMRHLKVFSLEDIKADILRTLVRQAVLLNETLGDPTRGKSRAPA